MKLKALLTFIAIMNLIIASNAGPIAVGICYAGNILILKLNDLN